MGGHVPFGPQPAAVQGNGCTEPRGHAGGHRSRGRPQLGVSGGGGTHATHEGGAHGGLWLGRRCLWFFRQILEISIEVICLLYLS